MQFDISFVKQHHSEWALGVSKLHLKSTDDEHATIMFAFGSGDDEGCVGRFGGCR